MSVGLMNHKNVKEVSEEAGVYFYFKNFCFYFFLELISYAFFSGTGSIFPSYLFLEQMFKHALFLQRKISMAFVF